LTFTQQDMRTAWKMLNEVCFGGLLDEPKFTSGSCEYENVFGVYYPDQERIHIDDLCTSYTMFISTMAHEMIHQWQDQNDKPVNHGNQFRSMAALIKRRTGLIV
jgi:hypothetical protein